MKKVKQIMVVITVIILAAVALTGTVNNSSQPINQFYTISAASDGNTLATWYDEKNITVAVVNREGKISKSKKIPVEKGDLLHKVEAACMGEDNKVYVLLRSCENDTGNSVKEELYILSPTLVVKIIIALSKETPSYSPFSKALWIIFPIGDASNKSVKTRTQLGFL